ncbi:hypothetical protein [Pseudomonas pseudonitroreducens]|uniref:hypothetical protein n=1 Tax=Pseudomonas pseudonitroreducens TaxID=2892326 RepID=UPI001F215FD4|nr:hypothetical protein [Pseudomonas pseudonitroreducens]
MTYRHLFITLILGSLGLAGCNEQHQAAAPKPAAVHRNWLDMPALPLLQEAVLSMAPKLEDGLTAELMNQICGLARGDLSQDSVTRFVTGKGIDAGVLLHQSGPLALLVNGDKPGQAAACAAHLVSGAFSTEDLEATMALLPEQFDGRDIAQGQGVDKESLSILLPVRLAVARANADVFALIAAELQRRRGLNPMQIREQSQQLFSRLAPTYLARIKAQFPAPGTTFRVLHLRKGQLDFVSSDGASFTLHGAQINLQQNGSMWYGDGKLLGENRTLQVAYFNDDTAVLLAPDEHSDGEP